MSGTAWSASQVLDAISSASGIQRRPALPSWVAVSPDLTRQLDRNQLEVMGRVWSVDAIAKNMSTSIYGSLIAVDESPLAEGLLYAGTDDGLIQVTEDGGKHWRKIDKIYGVPEFAFVNDIKADLEAILSQVAIEFYSDDDLDRLLALLT